MMWDSRLSPKLTSHSLLCESKLKEEIQGKEINMKTKYVQGWNDTYLELLAELGGRGPLASGLFHRWTWTEGEKASV